MPRRRATPCEQCADCQRSAEPEEPIAIDGTGKKGPLYRHVGDHPDLYWIDRGDDGTRVRITQVRALQSALHLAPNEGGWRAAVIADAEWLNEAAQNALLKLLEEPPEQTCLVLVTSSPAGLAATIRSRCQRVSLGAPSRVALRSDASPEEVREIAHRLDDIHGRSVGQLLDWAEEFRGPRAIAAQKVSTLIAAGAEWLRERVVDRVASAGEVARRAGRVQTRAGHGRDSQVAADRAGGFEPCCHFGCRVRGSRVRTPTRTGIALGLDRRGGAGSRRARCRRAGVPPWSAIAHGIRPGGQQLAGRLLFSEHHGRPPSWIGCGRA